MASGNEFNFVHYKKFKVADANYIEIIFACPILNHPNPS